MAGRKRVLFLLTFSGAACACSVITSWDDVRLGEIEDARAADAAPIDGGADAIALDANAADAGSDACIPATVICIDGSPSGTDTGAALYACNDAGAFDPPVACLHMCVHTSAANEYCSCNPGDTYCGGDNVIGDRDSLYECDLGGSSAPTFKQKCPAGCAVRPGMNDTCN